MATMIDALARSADRIFSSLDRPSDGGALSQYVASLGGGSEEQVALEKSLRLLHMFVRFGDALGTVQACDALVQLIRTGGATRQAVLDGSALPSLVLVLQTDRPDSWRAATELLAELAAGDDHQRRALLRSGAVPPLVQHLRHATEPTLLREGARLLAALAVEPTAATALLREGAARALVHLCRSDALQAHALSVRALGQLALTDAELLRSPQVLRVRCRVAGGSVLEARLAATRELTSLLELPTNRPPLLRAHVVAVLLQCADSLNEELKLAALRGAPMPQCPTAPLPHCPNVPMLPMLPMLSMPQYPNDPMTDGPMPQCANAPMRHAPMRQCANTLTPQHAPVHRRPRTVARRRLRAATGAAPAALARTGGGRAGGRRSVCLNPTPSPPPPHPYS
jgi:hypothetical protein